MKFKNLAVSAAVGLASVGAVVGLAGFGWSHGGGEKFMKKMVDARVEEVLDELTATADQRTKVASLEDGLLTDFQAAHQARKGLMTELLADFPHDQLDSAALDRAAAPMKDAEQKIKDDIRQAVIALHGILTPTQRAKLAQLVAEHHGHFGE